MLVATVCSCRDEEHGDVDWYSFMDVEVMPHLTKCENAQPSRLGIICFYENFKLQLTALSLSNSD